MKKLFVALGIIVAPLFSDTFVFSYHFNDGEGSIVKAMLIDIVHDSVKSRFVKNHAFRGFINSTKIENSSSKKIGVTYNYEVDIDMDQQEVEIGFNDAFSQFKQMIFSLSVEEINQLLKSKINQRFLDNINSNVINLPNLTEDIIHHFMDEMQFTIRNKEMILGDLNLDFQIMYPRDFFFSLVNNQSEVFHIQASDKDRSIIRHIITEMGEKDLYTLFKKRKEMNKMGDQIRHVPPMDFLAVIFSQDDLKHNMHLIKKNMFKWNSIVDNIAENMKKEKKLPNFEEKIMSFANYLGVDSEVLLHKVHNNDWSGFISQLF